MIVISEEKCLFVSPRLFILIFGIEQFRESELFPRKLEASGRYSVHVLRGRFGNFFLPLNSAIVE